MTNLFSPYFRDFDTKRYYWKDETLWLASADLPITNHDPRSLGVSIFMVEMLKTYEPTRTRDAELQYPVIVSSTGEVMDGYHRVAKSILQGERTIPVRQFVIDTTSRTW